MLYRTCDKTKGGCGERTPLTKMATYSAGGRHGFRNVCAECWKRNQRHRFKEAWNGRPAYRVKHGTARRARGRRLRHYVAKYLEANPCVHCGETDIRVLQFDHLDRATKIDSVSTLLMGTPSMKRLREEIAKCRVLCANCHQRHTAKQLNWWIHRYYEERHQGSPS